MGHVFATFSTWVTPTVAITKGEAWDENDPVVCSHPDWFSAEPPQVRTSDGSYDSGAASRAQPVEHATAVPGELRTRTDAAFDEAGALRAQLSEAGVKVDKRWSLERLRQEATKASGE